MSEVKDIYILLTDTGTVLTKIIRTFTKDPLNHASIAFDCDLTEVYSFGRVNPNNPFIAGFVQEDVRGEFFKNSKCELYRLSVCPEVYHNIRSQIQYFKHNAELYRYNLIGMLGVVFNIEWERRNAFFCSQFVATVFKRSGMSLLDKSPLLMTPGDLRETPNIELVYRGMLNACIDLGLSQSPASTFRTA